VMQYLERKGSRTRRNNPGGDDGDTLLLVGFLAVAAFVAYKNGLFSSIGIGSTSVVVPGDAGYVGQAVSNLPTAMLSTYAQLFAGGVAPSSGNVYWSPSTQKAYASSSSPTAAQISAGTMGTPAQLGWEAAMGPVTSQLIAMQNPGVTGFGNYWRRW
jgi:hypothetical protein